MSSHGYSHNHVFNLVSMVSCAVVQNKKMLIVLLSCRALPTLSGRVTCMHGPTRLTHFISRELFSLPSFSSIIILLFALLYVLRAALLLWQKCSHETDEIHISLYYCFLKRQDVACSSDDGHAANPAAADVGKIV